MMIVLNKKNMRNYNNMELKTRSVLIYCLIFATMKIYECGEENFKNLENTNNKIYYIAHPEVSGINIKVQGDESIDDLSAVTMAKEFMEKVQNKTKDDIHSPVIQEIRIEKVDSGKTNKESIEDISLEKNGISEDFSYQNKKHFDENWQTSNFTEDYSSKYKYCYVIRLNNNLDEFLEFLNSFDVKVNFKYLNNLNGIGLCLKDEDDIQKIKENKNVHTIEHDAIYSANEIQYSIPDHLLYLKSYMSGLFNGLLADVLPFKIIYRMLFGRYVYHYTGKDVDIYLLDTTINQKHSDIQDRIRNVFQPEVYCNNHGLKVASLIGGKVDGIAKEAFINVLNVVDCDGKTKLSKVLFALEKVKKNHGKGTLLNISVSGPKSSILNDVIDRMANNGIIIVTPAGNNHDLACNYSPGSADSAINVGSLDKYADISSFSNFGGCIRLYSIGEEIETKVKGKNSHVLNHGTSYSAAFVSGAIALYLEKNPLATSKDVWRFLDYNARWHSNGYLVQILPHLDALRDTFFKAYNNISLQSQRIIFYKKQMGIMKGIIAIVILIVLLFWIYRYFRNRKLKRKHHNFIVQPLQNN